MRAFRRLIVLIVLACLVPPLSLLMATAIARWAGCDIDPDVQLRCEIFGGDYGDILYQLTHFGWYAVETLPIAAAVIVSWLFIEIVRPKGKRAAPAKPQTPANSRKRARGS